MEIANMLNIRLRRQNFSLQHFQHNSFEQVMPKVQNKTTKEVFFWQVLPPENQRPL